MKELKNIYQTIRNKISYESASEMGWVIFGQSINVILGFLIIKIISKIGPEQYGVYALILTIAAVLGLFYGSFLQGFLRYYYHYEELNLRSEFVNLMFRFIRVTVTLFFILTIIFSLISPMLESEYSVLFFMAAGLFVISSKLSEFFNSILNLIRKRKENSLLQASERILMIASLLIFLWISKLELLYILFAFSCITFILAFIKISISSENLFRPNPFQKQILKNKKI